jgi:Tfp pilus assembly protein PilO
MGELLQRWEALKPAHRIGVSGGVPGMIFLVFYFLILGGLQTEIQQGKRAIIKEKQKHRSLAKEIKDGHLLEQALKLKKQQVDEIERKIPMEADPGDLLEQLSREAKAATLELRSFKPEAEIPVRKMSFIVNKAEFLGDFHAVGKFFDGINGLDRIVKVLAVQFRRVERAGAVAERGSLKTQLEGAATIAAFRLLRPEELKAIANQKRRR